MRILQRLKSSACNESTEQLSVENRLICWSFNIVSGTGKTSLFEPIRERIRKHKNKIRTSGFRLSLFTMPLSLIIIYTSLVCLAKKMKTWRNEWRIIPDKTFSKRLTGTRYMNFYGKTLSLPGNDAFTCEDGNQEMIPETKTGSLQGTAG